VRAQVILVVRRRVEKRHPRRVREAGVGSKVD
jgi:hypothetical protein